MCLHRLGRHDDAAAHMARLRELASASAAIGAAAAEADADLVREAEAVLGEPRGEAGRR